VGERRVAVEAQYFPLVLLDMGGVGRAPDDFREMFEGFRAANRRAIAEKARWVLVATTSAMPTAIERKIIIDEANTFSREEHRLVETAVLVIPNGFVRGAITLFGWTIQHLCPLGAAATTDAAVAMAAERVRKLGIEYPEERAVQAAQWFRQHESMARLRGAARSRTSGAK
jgi:hypothetical protein